MGEVSGCGSGSAVPGSFSAWPTRRPQTVLANSSSACRKPPQVPGNGMSCSRGGRP